MIEEKGVDYFKDFLVNAINNIEENLENRVKEGNPMKTNVVNLFIRELIIENPQEVKIQKSNLSEGSRLDLYFAGISVGHLTYEEAVANRKLVLFSDFRTIPGLERSIFRRYSIASRMQV